MALAAFSILAPILMNRPADLLTSIENPRIKAARKLHTRKGRLAAGHLLVEGVRLLADAWQSGMRPETVFYAPEMLSGSEGSRLLAQLQETGCPCFGCAPAVFSSLAETVTPQGIAAVLPLPKLALPAQPTLLLVLDGIGDPGNAGTLLRSAEAAGADGVIVGPGTVDPFNDKVVRAAMGAHFRLPLRPCANWEEVATLLPAEMVWYVADADAPNRYDRIDWCRSCAVIIGSEAHGTSMPVRVRSTGIQIPMAGAVESLNAAVAGSVVLFEAARQRRATADR